MRASGRPPFPGLVDPSASDAAGEEAEGAAGTAPASERERVLDENPALLVEYGETMLHVLMQVYSYAVNPSVRQMSLSCLANLLHFSSAAHISQLLCDVPFSAFIAALRAAQETAAASAALQMAEMLLVKLPQIFEDKFLCEGSSMPSTTCARCRPPTPTASRRPLRPPPAPVAPNALKRRPAHAARRE